MGVARLPADPRNRRIAPGPPLHNGRADSQATWPYQDEARAFQPTAWTLHSDREPFPHQKEGLESWWQAGGRGVVVLPTGTGKTFLAILAIQKAGRPTLVVTPTIDLLNQWYGELLPAFGCPIGLLGGGYYEFQPITVAPYDSAYLHLERWGHRLGLLVFDEFHHLPGPSYQAAAINSIARFGSASRPRPSGPTGTTLFSGHRPDRLSTRNQAAFRDFLAAYRTERRYGTYLRTKRRYRQAKRIPRLRRSSRHRRGSPNGWRRFLTNRSAPLKAERFQRIANRAWRSPPVQDRHAGRMLVQHKSDRVLIFTADNATVYQIARRFLIPAITHQTRAKERRLILERFHSGEYTMVVTSQVLNEGVDVPAASVGIILSGTGSVREHVQRLGRLLRKHGDKQALLYEVVTRDTAEEFTSDRRRKHHAYQ